MDEAHMETGKWVLNKVNTRIDLACLASISVGLGSKESQRNGIFGILSARKRCESQKEERGGGGKGRGKKEALAHKPLDFENDHCYM